MNIEVDEDPFGDEYGDGTDTLASFIAAGAPKFPIVDRSTLERYSICPAQARIVDSGAVLTYSDAANSGQEVHDAFSGAITEYIESERLDWSPKEFADGVLRRLRHSRPDVQPDVLDAAAGAVWKFTEIVTGMHPDNILKYDGGQGKRSGQLAIDIPECGIRFTSELDFLHSGPAKNVLHLTDWKSGWKFHDAASIEKSFQFGSHAVLILDTYPKIDVVEISVFNTRRNRLVGPVEFERNRFDSYKARLISAGTVMMQNRNVPTAELPCWPAVEKCRICDASKLCPIQPPPSVKDDPVEFVKSLIALEAKFDAMKAEAAEYVDATGEDIVTEDGTAFGRSKPASDRKPPAAIYTTTIGQREAKPRAKKKAEKITDAIVGGLGELLKDIKQETQK